MEKETFWLPKWCKTVNLLLKQISSRIMVDHTGCIISCGIMTLTHIQLSQWLTSQRWWNFIGDVLWATVCLHIWTSVVGLSRLKWIKTSARWKQSDCDFGIFCSRNVTNALKSFLSPQFQPSVLWLPVPHVTRSLCFQTGGILPHSAAGVMPLVGYFLPPTPLMMNWIRKSRRFPGEDVSLCCKTVTNPRRKAPRLCPGWNSSLISADEREVDPHFESSSSNLAAPPDDKCVAGAGASQCRPAHLWAFVALVFWTSLLRQ